MSQSELTELFLKIAPSIVGAYVGVKVALSRLETKVDTLSRDVDALALHIGTPRAMARALNQQQTNGDKP